MGLNTPFPLEIGGYVLAGGRSSRMGRDKALIPLAGKPLIEHAVIKLRRICTDVCILSSDPILQAFAPLVPDVHPNCGPIGGIEAALIETSHDWNLFLPLDMPFLPSVLLYSWASDPANYPQLHHPGIQIFNAAGRPQPGLCLIHKAAAPLITRAIQREEFALISVFEEAGRQGRQSFISATPSASIHEVIDGEPWQALSEAQRAAEHLWFLNLNTKEDLIVAQARAAALDT